MSKNSFTENFNNCIAGLPIASVAAHMVLHEGLLKDIGKVGALAGLGYLGYNHGDEIGNLVNKAGSAMGFGDHNAVGDTLGDWHNSAKTWVQDSTPGQFFNLGGDEAAGRRSYAGALAASHANINAEYKNKVAEAKYQLDNGAIDQNKYDAELKKFADQRDQRMTNAQNVATTQYQREMQDQKRTAAFNPNYQQYKDGKAAGSVDLNSWNAQRGNGQPKPPEQPKTPPPTTQPPQPTQHPQQQHPGLSDGSGGVAAGGSLHYAEQKSGVAQHNADVAANPGEGHIRQPGGPLKPNTTGPTYETPQARAEKMKASAGSPAPAPAATTGPLKPNTSGTQTYATPQARAEKQQKPSEMPATPTPAPQPKPQAMKINPQRFESLNQGQK